MITTVKPVKDYLKPIHEGVKPVATGFIMF